MPYNGRLYQPDFIAPEVKMPDWVQMGEDSGIDAQPMMSAFKRKLGGSPSNKTMGDEMGTMGKAMAPSSSGGAKMSL